MQVQSEVELASTSKYVFAQYSRHINNVAAVSSVFFTFFLDADVA